MSRSVSHRYEDPLDRVWVAAAARAGLRVVRGDSAYASTDGDGQLLIGTRATLDADDCLAQIVFHELCHALVEGDEALRSPDWGLDNETDRDLHREWACLRVQAALSGRYHLRRFLAPTTDHRAFYDALPEDPLSGSEEDPALPLARAALVRAGGARWKPVLHDALLATFRIVSEARPFASPGDLLAEVPLPAGARHPTGLPIGPPAERCATCAWHHRTARGRSRCRVAARATRADAPACVSWEPALDCGRCGACCREAYDVVEIGRREPVARRHPHLVAAVGDRLTVRRDSGRCAALAPAEGAYRCSIYEARPRTCRDFAVGGSHCLEARRRVGLTPPSPSHEDRDGRRTPSHR